jgi:hypothetical protein
MGNLDGPVAPRRVVRAERGSEKEEEIETEVEVEVEVEPHVNQCLRRPPVSGYSN